MHCMNATGDFELAITVRITKHEYDTLRRCLSSPCNLARSSRHCFAWWFLMKPISKTIVKQALKVAGFNGRIHFRKHNEFGTPDNFGPAMHRRMLDLELDISGIMYDVERDGYSTVVIYMEPKSYYHYRAILENPKHVWLESEVNGLRKQLGYCTNWSKSARDDMSEDIQRYGIPAFRISKEQTKFGLDWLKRTQWKLNGELRAGAFIGVREANIINKFARFEFIALDFQAVNPYTGCAQVIAPIYKVIAKNGDTFSYRVSPMGGFGANYEVVG